MALAQPAVWSVTIHLKVVMVEVSFTDSIEFALTICFGRWVEGISWRQEYRVQGTIVEHMLYGRVVLVEGLEWSKLLNTLSDVAPAHIRWTALLQWQTVRTGSA